MMVATGAVAKLVAAGFPLHVHLDRLGPRRLDSDNAVGALKHVRDAVAAQLGVDDGDETMVTWSYGQDKATTCAVRIEFSNGRRNPHLGSTLESLFDERGERAEFDAEVERKVAMFRAGLERRKKAASK